MAADTTTYDKALKNIYGGLPVMELNNATPLYGYVKKTSRGFDGRNFVLATHGRRNQQIGAQALTGTTLPGSASQAQEGYDNATYAPGLLLGVIAITEALMETSRTNEGAFVRALRSETEGMAVNFGVDFDRQLFGDGTGALTVCGTTSASTTVTVVSTARIEVGMGIDVVVTATGATSTGAVGRSVVSIASATTFVISGAAITTDATFSVYRAGSRTNEISGLQSIVSASGALGGLNPSTAGQEYWAAAKVDSSTSTISEVAMQAVYDAPQEQKYGGGGRANLVIGSFGARRSYQNLLQGLKRFSTNPLRLVGGFDALDFNGIPFFVDRYAPAKTIYFLDTKHLFLLQTGGPDWMQADGHILKWDTAVGYKGVYRWIVQFATDQRNAQGSLTNITES